LIVVGDLSSLADTTVLLLLLVFSVVNVSVLVLRRERVPHQHFQTPRAFPVVGIGVIAVLLAQTSSTIYAYAGALLALGIVLYLASNAVISRERGVENP